MIIRYYEWATLSPGGDIGNQHDLVQFEMDFRAFRRTSAIDASIGSDKRDTLKESQHHAQSKELNAAHSKVEAASQSYEKAKSRTSTLGAKQEVDEGVLANQLIQAGGAGAS
ncbi:hypothetical protein GCM10027567_13490 [Spongiibacter taiwanensis]